jgi:hypothetical protein
MKNRVWRIRIESAWLPARITGGFGTFEEAYQEREKLRKLSEFKQSKLVILPDPPFPHRFLDIG